MLRIRTGFPNWIFLAFVSLCFLHCQRWSGSPGDSEPRQQYLAPPRDARPSKDKDSLRDPKKPSARDSLLPLIA